MKGIVSHFDIVNNQIHNRLEVITYILDNISNIHILEKVQELIVELEDIKKIVEEIRLEQSIR